MIKFSDVVESLVRLGVVVDSGRKRRNRKTGELEIVWIVNPKLTKEQRQALIERPDVLQ